MSRFRIEGDALIEIDLIHSDKRRVGVRAYSRAGYSYVEIWPDPNISDTHRVSLWAAGSGISKNADPVLMLCINPEDVSVILTWFSGAPCPPLEILTIADRSARNVAWTAWKESHGD